MTLPEQESRPVVYRTPPRRERPVESTAIKKFDAAVSDAEREKIYRFLREPKWGFGWKSDSRDEASFPFFHRHFAGPFKQDRLIEPDRTEQLSETAPPLHDLWKALSGEIMSGHKLVRCYANGMPYGCDGTVHTDSVSTDSYTVIYYPHDRWEPNWGGETVFFSPDQQDIIASVYPKPNRIVVFPGRIPHVARGVSRSCPIMRVTLMFKTKLVSA